MRLLYEIHKEWKPEFTNFGDELNLWIWPHYLGEVLRGRPDVLLVGIGTVCDDTLPVEPMKIICGAGNGYRPPPRIDQQFRFYFVRGPKTAKVLGLPEKYAVVDPAVLVRRMISSVPEAERSGIVLMGHHSSAGAADWTFACRALGMSYVHPLSPWREVLERIRNAKLVVTEAMHGAIVADAMRVPWVPLVTTDGSQCEFKWRDWAESVGVNYRPIVVPAVWGRTGEHLPLLAGARRWVKKRQFLSCLSAKQLGQHTHLSETEVLDSRIDRVLEEIERVRQDAEKEGWSELVAPIGRCRGS